MGKASQGWRQPFHQDTKDSFRIYVNGKDEVRFHCFGECGKDWDIYDLIMLKDHCNFPQAQEKFAKFLDLKDVEFHQGRYQYHSDNETGPNEDPDKPIACVDDEDLTVDHRRVLQESAEFYNNLSLSRKEEYEKV